MRYSIVSFSGNVLPSVWDAKSDNEEGALQEALAMYSSRVSVVPGLLIDWQEGNVKRIVLNLFDQEAATLDNAKELFGIATTAEHFENIAQAMEEREEAQCQD
jgi:hypothetical protein